MEISPKTSIVLHFSAKNMHKNGELTCYTYRVSNIVESCPIHQILQEENIG